MPRALTVRGVPDSSTSEDEPAIGADDVDEDVEAVVEHGVSLEHAEDALEEDAHGAPHRLGVGVARGSTARRTCAEHIA